MADFFTRIGDSFSQLWANLLIMLGVREKPKANTNVTAGDASPSEASGVSADGMAAAKAMLNQTDKPFVPSTGPLNIHMFYEQKGNPVAEAMAAYHAQYNAREAWERQNLDSINSARNGDGDSRVKLLSGVAEAEVAKRYAQYLKEKAALPPIHVPQFSAEELLDARLRQIDYGKNNIIPEKIFGRDDAGRLLITLPSESSVLISRITEESLLPGQSPKYKVVVYPADVPQLNSGVRTAAFEPTFLVVSREELERNTTFVASANGNAADNAISIKGSRRDELKLQAVSQGARVQGEGVQLAVAYTNPEQAPAQKLSVQKPLQTSSLLIERRRQALIEKNRKLDAEALEKAKSTPLPYDSRYSEYHPIIRVGLPPVFFANPRLLNSSPPSHSIVPGEFVGTGSSSPAADSAPNHGLDAKAKVDAGDNLPYKNRTGVSPS